MTAPISYCKKNISARQKWAFSAPTSHPGLYGQGRSQKGGPTFASSACHEGKRSCRPRAASQRGVDEHVPAYRARAMNRRRPRRSRYCDAIILHREHLVGVFGHDLKTRVRGAPSGPVKAGAIQTKDRSATPAPDLRHLRRLNAIPQRGSIITGPAELSPIAQSTLQFPKSSDFYRPLLLISH